LPRRTQRYSPKLAVAFFLALAALIAKDVIAQDPTTYLTQNVLRVGEKLACRCGGCRNTVGNCPMLHCEFADPMRRRIAQMQTQGMPDSAVLAAIVKQEGVVALASPPGTGFGLFTWVMPGIALILGFFVYSRWVKRNRQKPVPVTEADRALIEKYRTQIDRDFEDEAPGKGGAR
jgi:cytochrome c-type biogenesis protein CcmH/NrfF